MKLDDLKPCASCGGPVAPIFFLVRITQALVMPGARSATASDEIRNSDDAVIVFGEKRPHLYTEVFMCAPCYHGGSSNLARIVERLGRLDEHAIEQADGAPS